MERVCRILVRPFWPSGDYWDHWIQGSSFSACLLLWMGTKALLALLGQDWGVSIVVAAPRPPCVFPGEVTQWGLSCLNCRGL